MGTCGLVAPNKNQILECQICGCIWTRRRQRSFLQSYSGDRQRPGPVDEQFASSPCQLRVCDALHFFPAHIGCAPHNEFERTHPDSSPRPASLLHLRGIFGRLLCCLSRAAWCGISHADSMLCMNLSRRSTKLARPFLVVMLGLARPHPPRFHTGLAPLRGRRLLSRAQPPPSPTLRLGAFLLPPRVRLHTL